MLCNSNITDKLDDGFVVEKKTDHESDADYELRKYPYRTVINGWRQE